MDGFWVLLIILSIFFGAVVVYLLFMFFLPEWVGITGKVALEAERSHQEGSELKEEDILDKMQKSPTKK